MFHLLAMFTLLQQQPPSAEPASTALGKVSIEPAEVAVEVGDTVRLRVSATDSAGRPVKDVAVRWFQSGGYFEGRVDSTGLVRGGSTGTLSISAVVSPRIGGSPATGFARVTVLPPPAAKLVFDRAVSRLYAGQSLVVTAVPYAANDDRRYDQVTWSSDAPAVVSVTSAGRLSAGRTGKATITARAGRAAASFRVTVVDNPVASVTIEPARTAARTGDVVRLTFQARSKSGRPVPEVAPEWSLSPGNAQVEPDGRFVADLPGSYRVSAAFAGRTAETTIEVRPRDVRRPTTLVGRLPLRFQAAEFWLHPNGRNGYLTTIADRMYALDLSNPAAPVITDSVVVDARTINDVMTTEDGKYGVLTRENA
jgi:hypothetical protein